MAKIKVNVIKNKKNNQMNFSLPKRKISKKVRKLLPKLKSIEINVEDFEFE